MNHSLKNKNDVNLIVEFKDLARRERELLTEILHYLQEIDSRKIYLARGYSSLFSFLTEEVGYSESSAQRRIQAMRLIRDIPEVETKIEKGGISLTVAAQMQTYFRQEEQKRKEEKQPRITREEKISIIQKLEGTSARECERKLVEIAPETCIPKEKTRAISPEITLIQFAADPELMKNINRLKTLLSHENPEGDLEKLFKKLSQIALDKLDPERRIARRQLRKPFPNSENQKCTSPQPAPAVNRKKASRYIASTLRDRIWVRDRGICQYRDKMTGKLCGANHNLELDHRYPFSLGGEHSEENLELKCRAHNQYRSELSFE